MKKLCFSFLFIFLSITFGYVFLIFGIPSILESDLLVSKYENILAKKTGFPVEISDFYFHISPNLSYELGAGKLLSKKSSESEIMNIQGVKIFSKNLFIKPDKFYLDKVYVDFSEIQSFMKNKNKKTKDTSFKLDYFPLLAVNNLYIKFDKESSVKVSNLHSFKQNGIIICEFLGEVKTPYTDYPIIIGEDGFIYYSDKLYVDDLSVRFDRSKLNISGEFENIDVFGESLPIGEIMRAFTFFSKK